MNKNTPEYKKTFTGKVEELDRNIEAFKTEVKKIGCSGCLWGCASLIILVCLGIIIVGGLISLFA